MRLTASVRFAPLICSAALILCALAPRWGNASTITWTGFTDNNWNTTSADWTADGVNNVAYTVGDNAVFIDNFSSNPTITMSATMNPATLTFSHIAGSTANTYSFGSSATQGNTIFGASATTALLLDTAFLGQVNLYARANSASNGTTTIKSGILEIHDGGALPANGTSNNVPGTV